MKAAQVREALRVLERVTYRPEIERVDFLRPIELHYPPNFVGPPVPLPSAFAIGAVKGMLESALQPQRRHAALIARGVRCADCGEVGVRTGHQECQYPGRAGMP